MSTQNNQLRGQSQVSTTITIPDQSQESELHLIAGGQRDQSRRPTVRWTDDVIDNEDLNRKKSKICCIFHPQREFGESSDSSSGSDSDSDSSSSNSDSEVENATHSHNHNHEHAAGDQCNKAHKQNQKQRRKQRRVRSSSPNAYEKQPTYKREPDAD